MPELRTSQKIVDAATGLIMVRGYNAFSFQDISDLVGIRKASVHHHFSTKSDLGGAVVRRAVESFRDTLSQIDATGASGLERIMAFAGFSGDQLEKGHMCPCAMLASEAETLPETINRELRAYYETVTGWLTACVQRGRQDGSITLPGSAEDTGRLVLAVVQGAASAARCLKSRTHFDAAISQLRTALTPTPANRL